MTTLDWFIELHDNFCHFPSREGRLGVASRSEVRRWFERKSIILNGVIAKIDNSVPVIIKSLVLFPKGKHKTTVW